ncbi:hypothetical protein GCM10010253_10870 [Streptomyces badius]|uniref:Uncharacterized protein n=1 Tax=Streptomyces badius TaxID=1941 RepID=A0ABQ2SWJ7_STRBA|nr:hypothetical protein GCM10010253_10870 [Streptomyces badius]
MFAGPDGTAFGGSTGCRTVRHAAGSASRGLRCADQDVGTGGRITSSCGWSVGTAYRFAECQNSDSFRPSFGARPAGS